MKKQLNDLFFEHRANRVDKWEQYLAMYQSELAPFVGREAPVRLLEIGVQNGGSLELWSKYLPSGSVVRGLDIDERVGELTFEGANIAVLVADATDASKIEELFGNETFDVIIDDGSHRSSHIIASFRLLFRHLSPGGKYIIEDLHCSYSAAFEGGYRARDSSIEWLKHLIDVLNADHIATGDEIPPLEREMLDEFGTSLARIAFYDSVAVIEKLPTEKTRPYRRLQSGRKAQVMSDEQWLSIEPIGKFRPILFGQAAARHLEPKLIASLEQAQSRAAQLDEALSCSTRKLAEALAHRDNLQVALDARDAAHRHRLRSALEAHEAAFRDQLAREVAAARWVRTRVRTGVMRLGRELRRAMRFAGRIRPGAKATKRRRHEAALCRHIFDRGWYLHQNPDVAAAGVDPLTHYLTHGAFEGRDPNPLFDSSWYLEQNPDVAAARVNPLVHYLEWGATEGRDPNPLFETSWYMQRYPDVAAAGINPLTHYLLHGAAERRDPNELFDTDWYLKQNPDVAATGVNALAHYLRHGGAEGRHPSERFETESYLEQNPEVAVTKTNPLAHYLQHRKGVGRSFDDEAVAYSRQVFREQQRFALEVAEILQHIKVMLYKPTFVVILENSSEAQRARTIASLQRQVYPHWSTCDLAEDVGLPDQVSAAEDIFLVWLGAGDVLSERALYTFASALNMDPSTDLVYADEDYFEQGERRARPFYKPAWSPDYLESLNYIGPAACFRGTVAAACWQAPARYYDFVLRFTERTSQIQHIREVLVHRQHDPAGIVPPDQVVFDVVALEERLRRTGRTGTVAPVAPGFGCYDVKIGLSSRPLISIVIPTAGRTVDLDDGRRLDLLSNCLDTITQRSTYRNLEFVIVDNGDLAGRSVDDLRRRGCKMITFNDKKFNIAKKLNLGVSMATGDMLLLLNDDIEPISTDWIERLLEHFEKPHVGVVGAKLLYLDGKIQHVGVVTNQTNPDHVRRHYPRDDAGYFFSTCAVRNFAAVTGACMMTRTDVYRRVGGYNESLAISYNDVDYCLKMRECGLTVVYAAKAELTHFESQSRKGVLDMSEYAYFQKRWAHMVISDPFYNEDNLSLAPPTFEVRHNPRWL